MGPVFEHASVDALGMAQIGAAVGRDAAEQDVVMAALDHVDGVDLHIAEMGDRIRHGLRAVTERRALSSRWACSQICRACVVVSGRGLGARDIAGGNVAGFAPGERSRPRTRQRKAALPSADSAAGWCGRGLLHHHGLLRLHVMHAGALHLALAHVGVGHGHFLVLAATLAGVSAVPIIMAVDFIMLSPVHAIIAADAGETERANATKAAAVSKIFIEKSPP